MNYIYLFTPKNPNLNHCPETFYEAFKVIGSDNNHVERLGRFNLSTILHFVRKLASLKSEEEISVFFFSIDSLIAIACLRIISTIASKRLKVYYMMHEPKFDKEKFKSTKHFLVYFANLLLGNLSDKVILPSNEAILKAKTFVENHKIYPINLTFISVSDQTLKKELSQLKCNWENSKTFSYICTATKDKNPQGFLSLARFFNKTYPDKTRFIRAGSDKNVPISYDEDIIVRFPDYISPIAKRFLLSLTHFAIIPYTSSTQSGAITEALSYGKLLIVNDIPAFSYLKELKFAFLINFNDEKAILECIDDVMNMDINDYEKRYWEAIAYFKKNHSEAYLSNLLSDMLNIDSTKTQ